MLPLSELPQRMLVVRVSEHVFPEEIEAVIGFAKLHSIEAVVVDRTRGETIPLPDGRGCFALIYLAGHGNAEFLEQPNSAPPANWHDVAQELCQSACMVNGAVVFCACCHGGMRSVARAILQFCPSVHFVCGPKSTVTTHTLTLGFHTFLYNFFFRRAGADEACTIVSNATGHAFMAHDRQSELQANLERSRQSPSLHDRRHNL
jgi:hypothetical protein